jgi:NAD(P)-dependent dehydrogenase (short-subunit alcohol dehydrogenase family)
MKNGNSPRVIVVTGASAGLGRAIAQAFAKTEGARIGLIARGKDRLEAAKREIEELGGDALILQADVADASAIEAAAEKVESEFGPIDVWVNNAMTSVFSPIKEMTAAEFQRVTEVTYLGCVNGTLAALKRMLPRDRSAAPWRIVVSLFRRRIAPASMRSKVLWIRCAVNSFMTGAMSGSRWCKCLP